MVACSRGVPASRGVSGPGGVPGPGVLLAGGMVCLVLGGAWSGGSASGGGGIPACTEVDTPSPRGRDGHCCGRYASYWNAFLFKKQLLIH